MLDNLKFVELDARDPQLPQQINAHDLVFHFAAITRAYDFIDPLKLFEHNLAATENVVASCKKVDVPLIFLSSTSTYESNTGIVTELTPRNKPKNLYALSKFYEEEIVQSYNKGYILRLGTIHGISPGMNFHTAVNKFCWEILKDSPVPLWEGAARVKSAYLSVKPLIRILDLIAKDNFEFPENRSINLVSHNSTPLEIFNTIKEFIPQAKCLFVEGSNYRVDDIMVNSIHDFLKPYFDRESLITDISDTLTLFKSKSFNWNVYYNTYGQ